MGIRDDTHAPSQYYQSIFSVHSCCKLLLQERVVSIAIQRSRYRVVTLKAAGFEHQTKQQLRLYAIFRS